MAGTRLVIQAIYVAQFFLLVLAALYFGLYRTHDPISFHLPIYHTGRQRIRQAVNRLEVATPSSLLKGKDDDFHPTKLYLPRIHIAVAGVQPGEQNLVEDILDTMKLRNHVAVTEINDELICDDSESSNAASRNPLSDQFSIVVCPSAISKSKPPAQIVQRQGITYLFPDKLAQVSSVFAQIGLESYLDDSTSNKMSVKRRERKRKPFKIFLVIEQQRKDWGAWAEALSKWMHKRQQSLQVWPCFNDIETEIVLSTLQETPDRKAKKEGMRMIQMEDMKASVLDRLLPTAHSQHDAWNVVLYIPRKGPVQFADKTAEQEGPSSQAMQVGTSTLVTTIDQAEYTIHLQENSKIVQDENGTTTKVVEAPSEIQVAVPLESLVDRAMQPMSEFLREQCLGVVPAALMPTGIDIIDTDLTVPHWQLDAWLRRALLETYEQAYTELREEAEWLLQSSTWVVIDNSVAAHWERLAQVVNDAYQTMTSTENLQNGDKDGNKFTKSKRYLDALLSLETTLDDIETLRTDPSLMEPLRFSAPQFLAIFAPLCLPLFLPPSIGVLREWKRYKRLQSKLK